MAGGSPESDKGKGYVEEEDKDPQQGGGEEACVQIFLQSRCSVDIALLCGDVGAYPPHGTGPRGVPGLGDAATDECLPQRQVYGSGITP